MSTADPKQAATHADPTPERGRVIPQRSRPGAGINLREHPREEEDRPAWAQSGHNAIHVDMVDISPGGACFVSPRPMAVGQAVRLQVGHGGQQAILDGRVVRYTPQLDGRYQIAICVQGDFTYANRFGVRTGQVRTI